MEKLQIKLKKLTAEYDRQWKILNPIVEAMHKEYDDFDDRHHVQHREYTVCKNETLRDQEYIKLRERMEPTHKKI